MKRLHSFTHSQQKIEREHCHTENRQCARLYTRYTRCVVNVLRRRVRCVINTIRCFWFIQRASERTNEQQKSKKKIYEKNVLLLLLQNVGWCSNRVCSHSTRCGFSLFSTCSFSMFFFLCVYTCALCRFNRLKCYFSSDKMKAAQ